MFFQVEAYLLLMFQQLGSFRLNNRENNFILHITKLTKDICAGGPQPSFEIHTL